MWDTYEFIKIANESAALANAYMKKINEYVEKYASARAKEITYRKAAEELASVGPLPDYVANIAEQLSPYYVEEV